MRDWTGQAGLKVKGKERKGLGAQVGRSLEIKKYDFKVMQSIIMRKGSSNKANQSNMLINAG